MEARIILKVGPSRPLRRARFIISHCQKPMRTQVNIRQYIATTYSRGTMTVSLFSPRLVDASDVAKGLICSPFYDAENTYASRRLRQRRINTAPIPAGLRAFGASASSDRRAPILMVYIVSSRYVEEATGRRKNILDTESTNEEAGMSTRWSDRVSLYNKEDLSESPAKFEK
ncbi:hypothetical protein BC629DRAFT_1626993 [Irpex lacteus]|nr:hypothetical protein BC629DRAFT_1626993 [Irpex lacteus]